MNDFNLDDLDVPDEIIVVDRNKEIWAKIKKRWMFIVHLLQYRIKSYTPKRAILDLITIGLVGCIVLNLLLHPLIIIVYIALFITIKLNSY